MTEIVLEMGKIHTSGRIIEPELTSFFLFNPNENEDMLGQRMIQMRQHLDHSLAQLMAPNPNLVARIALRFLTICATKRKRKQAKRKKSMKILSSNYVPKYGSKS